MPIIKITVNVSTVANKRARDGIGLQTELDDHCYKLRIAAERRSSEVLSTELTDDGPVYHAENVHLSPAKLITRSDGRCALAKYSKSELQDEV